MRKPYGNPHVPMMVQMSRYEQHELKAIEREQVTHPVDEYRQGSERLQRLYEQIDTARRFQWPAEGFVVNV